MASFRDTAFLADKSNVAMQKYKYFQLLLMVAL
jgi:hypothetical protein